MNDKPQIQQTARVKAVDIEFVEFTDQSQLPDVMAWIEGTAEVNMSARLGRTSVTIIRDDARFPMGQQELVFTYNDRIVRDLDGSYRVYDPQQFQKYFDR